MSQKVNSKNIYIIRYYKIRYTTIKIIIRMSQNKIRIIFNSDDNIIIDYN